MKKNCNELQMLREYNVVKSNDLIQKARYNLSMQEQKIILYLISKIKPEDDEFHLYAFNIQDFCEVCGIDAKNGGNYAFLKDTVINLISKVFWIKLENGMEVTARWIDRAYVDKNSGTMKIKLDEFTKPYLLQLKERFTAYSLYFTLAMQSKYSIRLYEILKSYEYQKECEFEIEELKKKLFAETYEEFKDFRVKVIDVAMREINAYGDITVTYELEKQGRKFHKIKFTITPKSDIDERMKTFVKIDKILNS